MHTIGKYSLILSTLAFSAAGCVTSPLPPTGGVFTDLKGPHQAQDGKHEAKKHGQSCAAGVLGLVAWGDASIDSARKSAKITDISSVDYSNFSVLGVVYTKTCALVSGT